MEHKKYAPLIGKELTWETLESLIKSVREDVLAEQRAQQKTRQRRTHNEKVFPETDGA